VKPSEVEGRSAMVTLRVNGAPREVIEAWVETGAVCPER
jgi:hypothetical protein